MIFSAMRQGLAHIRACSPQRTGLFLNGGRGWPFYPQVADLPAEPPLTAARERVHRLNAMLDVHSVNDVPILVRGGFHAPRCRRESGSVPDHAAAAGRGRAGPGAF